MNGKVYFYFFLIYTKDSNLMKFGQETTVILTKYSRPKPYFKKNVSEFLIFFNTSNILTKIMIFKNVKIIFT